MLVKCSWCAKNFNSERYGRQFCPHCGAELDLPAPATHEAMPEPKTVRPGEGAAPTQPGAPAGGADGKATMLDPWTLPPGAPAGWQRGTPTGQTEQSQGSAAYGGGAAGGVPPAGQWGAGGSDQSPPGQWGAGGAGGGVPPQGPWGGGALPPGGSGGMPPGFDGPPQDQDSPWERRREIGFFPALVETWKQASLDPKRFYARLKTTDIGEAFLYGWILSTLSYILTGVWAVPVALMTGEDTTLAFAQVIGAPILSAIGLFVGAGLVHIGCMILGCASRGFDATFRTVAYAQGPQILGIVPVIGGIVAGVWMAVITIQGLQQMQRTTSGKATGAVLMPGIVFLLCCGCGFAVMFFSAAAAMGGGFGSSF